MNQQLNLLLLPSGLLLWDSWQFISLSVSCACNMLSLPSLQWATPMNAKPHHQSALLVSQHVSPCDGQQQRYTMLINWVLGCVCVQNWVFGPAWTVFYTSMGVASWMVWKNGKCYCCYRLLLLLLVCL